MSLKLVNRGQETRALAREILRLRAIAQRKKSHRDDDVPVLITPPIQSNKERGQGDSINAKLHRLLNG